MLIFQENDPFHFGSLGRSMFTMLKLETLDGWDEVLYLAVFGCANYPAYDYSENNPNMNCKKDKSFGFGWIGAVIISAIVLIGAYVLPTVLIGIVSIKFDEATTYFETARVMRQNTARVVAKTREELPDLLTNARLDDCRTLFDQLDADSSLTLDFRALAPFYHYTFAKLFGVELSPDQGESLYQSMDTNGNADVSFDEFIHFIATIKKIEKRCKNDPVYQNKKFGEDAFKMIKTVTERSKWNGAMARANHESVELAWDEIFTVLNGEDGNSPREKAMSLFRTIDSDKSGEIDEEELILGLASCGCHMTKAQVHSFIADVDSNEDGQLSFEEFVSLITNKIKERDQEKTMRERSETEALVRNHRNRILSPRLIKLAQSFSSLSPSESTSSTSSHSSSLTPPSPTERFVNQKMKHAEEAQLDEMRDLLFPELGNFAHAPASSVLAGLTESCSEEETQ
jgi:Ca2+-binding EF-hand superfamily protein